MPDTRIWQSEPLAEQEPHKRQGCTRETRLAAGGWFEERQAGEAGAETVTERRMWRTLQGAGCPPSLQGLVETLRLSDKETSRSSSLDWEENSRWELPKAGRWDGELKDSWLRFQALLLGLDLCLQWGQGHWERGTCSCHRMRWSHCEKGKGKGGGKRTSFGHAIALQRSCDLYQHMSHLVGQAGLEVREWSQDEADFDEEAKLPSVYKVWRSWHTDFAFMPRSSHNRIRQTTSGWKIRSKEETGVEATFLCHPKEEKSPSGITDITKRLLYPKILYLISSYPEGVWIEHRNRSWKFSISQI